MKKEQMRVISLPRGRIKQHALSKYNLNRRINGQHRKDFKRNN